MVTKDHHNITTISRKLEEHVWQCEGWKDSQKLVLVHTVLWMCWQVMMLRSHPHRIQSKGNEGDMVLAVNLRNQTLKKKRRKKERKKPDILSVAIVIFNHYVSKKFYWNIIHIYTIHLLKVYISMVLTYSKGCGTITTLSFRTLSKWNPVLISSHPPISSFIPSQTLATTNLLFVSMELPMRDLSYRWTHTKYYSYMAFCVISFT